MIQLVLGLGKVGVQTELNIRTGEANIYLGTLSKTYKPGDTFKDDDLESQKVLLTFLNKEGLDVLRDALDTIKKFDFKKIPIELQMGA